MTKKPESPSPEQWKRLYDLMAEIKEHAPWEYMHEDDLFGIYLPGTNQYVFVSVMGNLGEHLSVAVYLGKRGFEDFWTMQNAGYNFSPDLLLQTPHLQASLEDRDILTSEDRKVIRGLNFKYRGRQAWPQFRSYRPGCFPWYLEREEAQILITALEQLIEVAPRFENDTGLLESEEPEEYLVRVLEEGQWVDRPFFSLFASGRRAKEPYDHWRKLADSISLLGRNVGRSSCTGDRNSSQFSPAKGGA